MIIQAIQAGIDPNYQYVYPTPPQGLKSVMLVAIPEIALMDDPISLIEECIKEGSILEIEY